MIVTKAVRMAEKMSVPILGAIENMSYAQCPDCGKKIPVFGESQLEAFAKGEGLHGFGAAAHRSAHRCKLRHRPADGHRGSFPPRRGGNLGPFAVNRRKAGAVFRRFLKIE